MGFTNAIAVRIAPLLLLANFEVAAQSGSAAASSIAASSFVGLSTADTFPPTGTAVNPSQFPPESVVGFPGPTPTGVEPDAIASAATYPYNQGSAFRFPLVVPEPFGENNASSTFDISQYWGNLSPWYSLRSADYGLPDANPLIPDGCEITQLLLLYRHGARYPTTGAAPGVFASKLANATASGFSVSGELAFLSNWTYQLGAELLTPFGRSQLFELGVSHRQLYGKLLNNFTAAGALPVFRTQSQDRMVKTAENFAAGFFGVPEYMDQVNIEILVETPGLNNSGAPYENCNNSNIASRGSIGSTVAKQYANNAFNSTLARLQSQISGINLTSSDITGMLQLCSYETVALGYSPFCDLFTEDDFRAYEYYFDLTFYYNNGPGSPVSAAQGKGYLDEYIGRFTGTFPAANSSLNETFDSNSTFFPLTQSIYADATHEVVVLDTLMAFNLTAIFSGPPLSPNGNSSGNSFVASKVVPFATHFTAQVLSCPAYQTTKQIRFLLNDAVIPLNGSYAGCDADPNGLCSFDNVVEVLKARSAEIDYAYDCFANYTASPGKDYNGRAPRS